MVRIHLPQKKTLLFIGGVLVLVFVFSRLGSSGGVPNPFITKQTNYHCDISLYNQYFGGVQITSGTQCGKTGSCYSSLGIANPFDRDAGTVRMTVGGVTASETYEILGGKTKTIELNVCAPSGVLNTDLTVFSDDGQIVDRKSLPIGV